MMPVSVVWRAALEASRVFAVGQFLTTSERFGLNVSVLPCLSRRPVSDIVNGLGPPEPSVVRAVGQLSDEEHSLA
jgi:hypothetical protein